MQVGFGAYRDFKVIATTASGGEIGNFTFRGTASVENFGGNVTDVMPWGGAVTFDGKPTGSGIYNIF